ncbi:MAG: hypothetical protein IKE28_09900 [Solobacterium sp.]|nr:hypothetical protein [Solobacterium sp.]
MNTEIDWGRIRHLLKLGILAALMVLAGDMLLGWGVSNPAVTEVPAMLSRYLSVSDGRIFASALLGLIGIPMECLCWFAVYRMIQPYSKTDAHAYRAGIIGCLAFGGCGVHVPCCMAVYLLKHFYADNPAAAMQESMRWISWFLLPATVIFAVFFFLAIVIQIKAFVQGHTPLPRWCWVFSILFGLLFAILMRMIGDYGLTNALATGWISIGNLWMMGGLLIVSGKRSI